MASLSAAPAASVATAAAAPPALSAGEGPHQVRVIVAGRRGGGELIPEAHRGGRAAEGGSLAAHVQPLHHHGYWLPGGRAHRVWQEEHQRRRDVRQGHRAHAIPEVRACVTPALRRRRSHNFDSRSARANTPSARGNRQVRSGRHAAAMVRTIRRRAARTRGISPQARLASGDMRCRGVTVPLPRPGGPPARRFGDYYGEPSFLR